MLYLIYVNDIGNSCQGNILSFADDTTLYTSHSNIPQLYENANKHVNELYDWFCCNRLSLNAKKTKFIVIRPKHKKQGLGPFSINIRDTRLDRVGNDCLEKSTKFLGIHLYENLSWKQHITEINKKVSRALFSIKQVKKLLPLESLRTLYFALIHSHLLYGIVAWGTADLNIIKPITMIQKRAIRVINNAPYNSHTDPKFKKSRILKIPDLYEYKSVLFIHDYLLNKLPNSFEGIFPKNQDMPNSRETRQSNLLHVPRYSAKFAAKLPIFSLPSIWNKWSRSLPENSSKFRIQRYIQSAMLHDY